MQTFRELPLIEPLQRAIAETGYETPTPIQRQCIPSLLDGRDVLGCAQTGTGKTAAFALPVLQLLHANSSEKRVARDIRALVIAPTRELAAQIAESFGVYGKHLPLRYTMICGGINPKRQVDVIRRGLDILIATPGRLLDLMGQGEVDLAAVEMLVLDEADRMLDMGFLPDIRRILRKLPTQRQSLLFSATMPGPIEDLAKSLLRDPVHVEVTPPATTVERIEQEVLFVEKANKPKLLLELLQRMKVEQAIVFSRTKHGANRLVDWLDRQGVSSAALHGNKSQNARERALNAFRDGSLRILVATDIAARGIDVEGVSHVFNYDLPNEPESYVHRIGRTGRAGRDGVAISFCCDEELAYLRDIERTTDQKIEINVEHPYHVEAFLVRHHDPRRPPRPPVNGGGQRGGQRDARGGGGGRPSGGGGGRPSSGGGGQPDRARSGPRRPGQGRTDQARSSRQR